MNATTVKTAADRLQEFVAPTLGQACNAFILIALDVNNVPVVVRSDYPGNPAQDTLNFILHEVAAQNPI